MRIRMFLSVAIALLSLAVTSAHAEDLMMMRVNQSFPETMVNLQSAIIKSGYKISRVQRVDIGLTKSGFQTDKYRVVFFGKPDQIKKLIHDYPDLIPFLPLKISIFSENNDTIVISTNPQTLKQFYPDIPDQVFAQWSKDIEAIFELVRSSE